MTIFPARKVVSPFVGVTLLLISPLISAQDSPETPEPLPYVVAHPPIQIVPFISSTPIGYTPSKMRHAYGFDLVTGTGSGQTIAIVEAYGSPTIQADLNLFCNTFGLQTGMLTVYYPQGVPRVKTGATSMSRLAAVLVSFFAVPRRFLRTKSVSPSTTRSV